MTYKQLFDLTGQVAVITGGARGIGKAIAHGLGTWGARIVIVDVLESEGRETIAALDADGIDAHLVLRDITEASAFPDIIREVVAHFGGFHILINNAGISARVPAEDYPDDAFDTMVELNLTALFRGMRSAARHWINEGSPGRIVNLASFAGMVADPLSAPYAATKGAVVQLTKTCAVEWAPHDIRVNAIGPGYVRTEMTAHTLDSPESSEIIRAKTALGRPATPDEIVGAAIYLSSAASSYTTGHVLMVDGGWTAM